MPFQHVETWKDELGPAYALGQGAAAPTMTVLTESTFTRGLAFGPGDRADVVVQFNHDVHIPGTGNLTFHPHVHYTFLDNPTAGDALRWKFTYRGAKPSIDGSAVFPSTHSTVSSSRRLLTATEIRKHYLDELGEIVVPSSAYDNSFILWGTFELSTLSTIANGKCALLAFDIHKQVRNHGAGSPGEYSG